MSSGLAKPIIFISYAHADEPEKPAEGEVRWLSFVQQFLQPAVKDGIFELWVDRLMKGGANWDPEIDLKLRKCDVFILLISARSMASSYIVDKEIAIIRERQSRGENIHFYPLLLTPTPDAGLSKVSDKNLRPRDAKPFSSFPLHERMQHMTDAANEIAGIIQDVKAQREVVRPAPVKAYPTYVHVTGLPETGYERLVGRASELQRLDDAWADSKTNIISLVAEGGAGKSALVNEWLTRLQADGYRGAEMVLGWSFYSQGTKERATSAEEFLDWALEKLGIATVTNATITKGELIAESLAQRRVLLVLDGVEPLQHGPGPQQGQLKDQGLRALLRRFAATPPSELHGLVVLTSRLPIKDIERWEGSAAPVIDVERLSDEAGAALLRDNGVWGTDKDLKIAAHDFGGHPLALGLLASFLTETQKGDVRRRDHIRDHFADSDNPRHDHARRVMESYEKEWLKEQPILLAIMYIVGLFDRPASGDSVRALRSGPIIDGLTDEIAELDQGAWQRAIARLRGVRLLSPLDPSASDALDAHPLIREWFGDRLRIGNEGAWKAAHGRLYEHLRDTTNEGGSPTLESISPLYQAIAHGCKAGRYQESLDEIYIGRICQRGSGSQIKFYSLRNLGAYGSDLAAISWFFSKPFEVPTDVLRDVDRAWVLGAAADCLRGQGRLLESLPAYRAVVRMAEAREGWGASCTSACNLAEGELLAGQILEALAASEKSVDYADRTGDEFAKVRNLTVHADVLLNFGRYSDAESVLRDAENREKRRVPKFPFLTSLGCYRYCELILDGGDYAAVKKRVSKVLSWESRLDETVLSKALVRLALGRAFIGLAGLKKATPKHRKSDVRSAGVVLADAIDRLLGAGTRHHFPRAYLARAVLNRQAGAWNEVESDLDEVKEIAEPGQMRLYLCDAALEAARLRFARIEALAPFNGLIGGSPSKLDLPDPAERSKLLKEAAEQLTIAASYIEKCGYHRRDKELAELQGVLKGEKKFADLPLRV